MNQSATSILLRHWLEVGGRLEPPSRMAINPSRIASVLEWMITLEVPDMRIRVRGSKIEPWLSSPWCGYLQEAFEPLDAAAVSLMGEELSQGRQVRRSIRFSDRSLGTMLLLPLTMNVGGICRAVGAIDYPGMLPAVSARLIRVDHIRLVYSRETA